MIHNSLFRPQGIFFLIDYYIIYIYIYIYYIYIMIWFCFIGYFLCVTEVITMEPVGVTLPQRYPLMMFTIERQMMLGCLMNMVLKMRMS